MFGPVEPVFSVEERQIVGGLRARIYRPAAREGLIHGAYRMPGVLPGARDMLTASADAWRKAFGPAA